VACASTPERAREALAAESPAAGPWKPAGELAVAFDGLPERLTCLVVGDHRGSAWPDALAQLPATVQSWSAMLGGFAQADAEPSAGLLGVLGVPGPGVLRLRLSPAQIPTAEQLRPYLFPSVLAATADDRGFRLISREALPLACFGNSTGLKSSKLRTTTRGIDQKLKLRFGLGN
jgi:hypothetical protein